MGHVRSNQRATEDHGHMSVLEKDITKFTDQEIIFNW